MAKVNQKKAFEKTDLCLLSRYSQVENCGNYTTWNELIYSDGCIWNLSLGKSFFCKYNDRIINEKSLEMVTIKYLIIKMNRKSHIFFLLLLVLFSCTEKDNNEYISSSDDKYAVSLEDAKNVAATYLANYDFQPQTRSSSLADSVCYGNCFTIKNDQSEPILHVINYKNGGFTLVSTDNRINPILGYSDEGFFDNQEMDYPEGLIEWIHMLDLDLKYIRDNNYDTTDGMKKHWASCMKPITRMIQPEFLTCEDIDLTNKWVGPLLSTTWNQTGDYASDMKYIVCNGIEKHAYVGCVPIAMAQTMKYWNYPAYFNWNNMANSYATSATRSLFSAIHNTIGASNINYDCEGTGVTMNEALSALRAFGYTSAVLSNYDYLTVYREIENNRPVILSGSNPNSGHCWVCDGLHSWDSCITLSQDETDIAVIGYLHYHMNWGWGGYCDGWYAYNDFTTTSNISYNSNRKMIYNIHN